MARVEGNLKTITSITAGEFGLYGHGIVEGLYGTLIAMARAAEIKDADGNVTGSLVPWVSGRENTLMVQVDKFVDSLSGAAEDRPTASSRAVSAAIGINIFDSSVDTVGRCKTYINDLCSDVYNADYAAYEKISENEGAVTIGAQKPFTFNQWFAAQEFQRYLFNLEAYGHFYAKEWDRVSVLSPLERELRDHLFGMIGRGFDSYEAYKGQMDMWWRMAIIMRMQRRQGEIMAGGYPVDEKGNPVDLLYPLPDGSTAADVVAEYKGIKELVYRAGVKQSMRGEDTYLKGSAFILYDLSMDCQEVGFAVYALNAANPFIPADERDDFEMVYQHVTDYQKIMCNDAKPIEMRYEPKFNMNKTYIETLDDKVDEVWDEYLNGNWDVSARFHSSGRGLYNTAADKGLLTELDARLASAKARVKNKVEGMEEKSARGAVTVNPWKGPVLMRGDGFYVPFNGFESGGSLYLYWIRNLVGTEFSTIFAWLDGAESSDVGVFRVSESFIRVVLKNMWIRFDAKLGGTVNASVLDEAWANFKAWAADEVGKVYENIDKFNVDKELYAKLYINAGLNKLEAIRSFPGKDIPIGFNIYEQKYKDNVISGLSTVQLVEDFEVVSFYNTKIPSEYRARYEAVYKAYADALDYRGGDRYQIVTWDFLNGLALTIADQVRASALDEKNLLIAVYGNDAGLETLLASYQRTLVSEFAALAGQSMKVSDAYKKMMAIAVQKGAPLNDYLVDVPVSCEAFVDKLIADVKAVGSGDISDSLKQQADMVVTGFSNLSGWDGSEIVKKVGELANLLRRKLGAGLKPFMTFDPMKGRGAFELEEFAIGSFQDLMDKWASSRLKAGVYVEPKIDGYRATLESFGGRRKLFLEGGLHDLMKVYPELDEDLGDVIFDGELVGELDGKVAPRIESGSVSRGRLDAAVPLLFVFDILYLDGKDLHGLPYYERRKVLDNYFATHKLKHVRELPAWRVDSSAALKSMIERARRFDGSEGAMLKEAAFTYVLGGKTLAWAKVKRSEDVHVVVLSVDKNKSGTRNYECGVAFYGDTRIDPEHVKVVDGLSYMVLGKTFGSTVRFSVGDKIEVAVTKIIRRSTANGVWYDWQDPRIKGIVSRNPDTIAQIGHVSQLLGASISEPYRFLMNLYDKSMDAVSADALRSMYMVAEGLFNELHYPRLRRIALMVLTSIEDRMTPSGRPGDVVGDKSSPSGERGEVAGHVVVVTDALVTSVEDTFNNVRDNATMEAHEKRDRAVNLLVSLRQMEPLTDGDLLIRVAALKKTVSDYVDMMGTKKDVSHAQILKDLARMEAEIGAAADDLTDPTRIDTAYRVREELDTLNEKITTSLYNDQVGRIELLIQQVLSDKEEDATYYGAELVSRISAISDRIDSIIASLHDNPSDFVKSQLFNVYSDLKQLVLGMGVAQLKAYGGQTDELMNKILEAWPHDMPMPLFLGGASPVVGWQSKLSGWIDWAIINGLRPAIARKIVLDFPLKDKFREMMLSGFFERIEDVKACEDLSCVRDIFDGVLKKVARAFEDELESEATDEKPVFEGSANASARWVASVDDPDFYLVPLPGQQVVRDGGSVLLLVRDGDSRIGAMMDSRGVVLSGDPSAYADFVKRTAYETLENDRYIKGVRADFGEEGVKPFRHAVDKLLSGSVMIGGCGGFYGGNTNGKPFFVTASHCPMEEGPQDIVLSDGTAVRARLLWRRAGAYFRSRDFGAHDVAIYVVDDPASAKHIIESMKPLEVSPPGVGGLAVVLSSEHGGEVDVVNPSTGNRWVQVGFYDSGPAPAGWDQYGGVSRARPGYSGSPIVDTSGRVVGLWNAGTNRGNSGAGVSAQNLLDAYRQAGLYGDRLQLTSSLDPVKVFAAALGPFAGEPVKLPVRGVLYDVRGEGEDHKELVFDWRSAGDTAIVVDIGGPADEGKLLKYQGGKLVCHVGKPLDGTRSVVSGIEMLPSRMKTAKTGERYYEMYLKFDRLSWLNGLWGVSEKAGSSVGVDALMFRLDGVTPFWARDDAKHRRELGQIPVWQRPSFVTVEKFFGGKDGTSAKHTVGDG